MRLGAVDLFCGAGGLSHGLILEGVPVLAGIDVDPACRYPFEKNNGARFLEQNVSDVTPDQLSSLFARTEVRILAGCAPCQPFSTYAQRFDTTGSPRWALLREFARLVNELQPEVVTMENVPSVAKHEVYTDFVSSLDRLGYVVWHDVVDCSDYGLPQRRRRRVLLASRLGSLDLVEPTHDCRPLTVRHEIGRLQPLAAGESSSSDRMHVAATLSPLNLKRIRASKPGGTWRDWPSHLVAKCHRNQSGITYPSVYGRMEWDSPAPTLTTQFFGFGSGRFGHPEQDRALSLREGALLQGFPDTYSFIPAGSPIHFKTLGRMVGNAVPVTLGRVIGRSIRQHLGVASPVAAKSFLSAKDTEAAGPRVST